MNTPVVVLHRFCVSMQVSMGREKQAAWYVPLVLQGTPPAESSETAVSGTEIAPTTKTTATTPHK
jgi:hypothetical protein